MEKQLKCISCNRPLENVKGNASFSCPQCEKHTITRCFYCRRIAARYTCPGCNFTGPN
ncbi:MAG TPA: zinc finger domain-containing protein [Candidatus Nanoarchaeia archaeon]|nr:zinc finger domain-containing protein [Candidatus Nanoarchaeia archaeon]